MFKVILIQPPSQCIDDDRLEPPLGLLYIAAVLRQNEIAVQIYDMTGCKTDDQIKLKLDGLPAGDIYGFTTYCTNYPCVKQCIDYIRGRDPGKVIVLGGPNPSALPEFSLYDSQADHVIIGEGEQAFTDLVRAVRDTVSMSPIIRGVAFDNIDAYPFPAWDLVDLNDYTRLMDGQRIISIISSRGCKYTCVHCNSVVMGGGNRVRYRSIDNLREEIRYLQQKGFHRFRFNDDNFAARPDLDGVLDMLKRLNIRHRIFARVEDLTDHNCRMLAESGCRHISVGLESLNPDNLRVLGKATQSGCEYAHLGNARRHKIVVRVYFLVGLPFDTDATIKRDYQLAAQLPFDEYSLYPLIPYPGTAIAKWPHKYGYEIIDNDFTNYVQLGKGASTAFVLRHTNFTEDDVERWYTDVLDLFAAAGKIPQRKSIVAR